MEISDEIIDSLFNIGATNFFVYCYIRRKFEESNEEFRFNTSEAIEKLNISKPIIYQTLKELKKLSLIDYEVRNSDCKIVKRLFVKCLPWSKKCLPNENFKADKASRVKTKGAYSNNIIISINYKELKDKKTIPNLFKDIILKVMNHPRYSNQYYLSRKWKCGRREEIHIQRLMEQISKFSTVDDYVDWWLKKKASKVSGFNVGILSCQPMIEEFLIENKFSEKVWKGEIKKEVIDKFKLKIIKSIVDSSQIEGYKPSQYDKEILDKAIKNKTVVVKNGKLAMAVE